MHPPSIWAIIIILVLVVILFGKPGRLSGFMEDLGKGIKGFRKGVGDNANEQPPAGDPPRQVRDESTTSEAQRQRENQGN
jgi:sec-independent protein translocase protein TatA